MSNLNPITNPPDKFYDPDRYDVGHWGDKEVYVYAFAPDKPEGDIASAEEITSLLTNALGNPTPNEYSHPQWDGKGASMALLPTNQPMLAVLEKGGHKDTLFYTADLNAILYLLSLPEFAPEEDSEGGEDLETELSADLDSDLDGIGVSAIPDLDDGLQG